MNPKRERGNQKVNEKKRKIRRKGLRQRNRAKGIQGNKGTRNWLLLPLPPPWIRHHRLWIFIDGEFCKSSFFSYKCQLFSNHEFWILRKHVFRFLWVCPSQCTILWVFFVFVRFVNSRLCTISERTRFMCGLDWSSFVFVTNFGAGCGVNWAKNQWCLLRPFAVC